MAFDFPNNPTDGQTVLHDNGKYYKWDATAGIWNVDVGKRIQDFIDGLIDGSQEVVLAFWCWWQNAAIQRVSQRLLLLR